MVSRQAGGCSTLARIRRHPRLLPTPFAEYRGICKGNRCHVQCGQVATERTNMRKLLIIAVLTTAVSTTGCAPAGDEDRQPAGERQPAGDANQVVTTARKTSRWRVPAEVLAAAQAARPGFTPAEAERETRDGRHYFDIGGTLADGSSRVRHHGGGRPLAGRRDPARHRPAAAPAPVRQAAARDADFAPTASSRACSRTGCVI